MKRKKIFMAIIAAVILLFICGHFIYNHYYKIDTALYSYGFHANMAESPDKLHNVFLIIYRVEENSEISYIMGILNPIPLHGNSRDVRTIFWQKVDTESIGEKNVDGVILTNWIDLDWVDNDTVEINDISVNINKGYDYRRKYYPRTANFHNTNPINRITGGRR